jgi:hypothetical protein
MQNGDNLFGLCPPSLTDKAFIDKANFLADKLIASYPDLSSLHISPHYAGQLPIEVIEKLLNHGLNPQVILALAFKENGEAINISTQPGRKIFQSDKIEHQYKMVELSLKYGGNPNAVKIDAIIYSPKLAALLIDNGLNPNSLWKSVLLPYQAAGFGWPKLSPYLYAELRKNTDEIHKLIIEKGASPEFILPMLASIDEITMDSNIESMMEANFLAANLPTIKADWKEIFSKQVKISDIIQNCAGAIAQAKQIAMEKLGEETTYLHLFAALGSTKMIKVLNDNLQLELNPNLTDDKGQSALFFARNGEFFHYLQQLGADINIVDNNGSYWFEHANKWVVKAAHADGLIPSEHLNNIGKKYYTNGDFYLASKLMNDFSNLDFEEMAIEAIIKGIGASPEPYKYNALINIYDKHNLDLPKELSVLVNTVHTKVEDVDGKLLASEQLRPLAQHFLKLAKSKFIQDISNQQMSCDLKTVRLIDEIFAQNGKDAFLKLHMLKNMFPFNKVLASIDSEFDALHKTLGLALNLLDEDHAHEVLALSSLAPAAHKQNIMVYRGIAGNFEDSYIDYIFSHGHRAGGDLFSYYVNNREFSWKPDGYQGDYNFGGTYFSVSFNLAAAYAKNGGLIIEAKQDVGSVKRCGVHALELVLSNTVAKDIKAIYQINENNELVKTYFNPNYISAEIEVNLEFNFENIEYIGHDEQGSSLYKEIECIKLNPVERYNNSLDFISKFDSTALAQERYEMYSNIEDTLDICLVP